MIPTMIKVSGGDASAAIATGQAVGAVGAVLIACGWIVSGPAAVARVDAVGRRTEYLESLRTRLVICVPAAACALVAVLVVRTGQDLAALGSVSTATIGLTASWYFAGTGQRDAQTAPTAEPHPDPSILWWPSWARTARSPHPAPAGNELRDSGPAARPAASPISTASGSTERTPTPNGSGSRTATPWSKTPDLTGRHGRQGCQ